MSGLRFEHGEQAVMAIVTDIDPSYQGQIVTVWLVGPFVDGSTFRAGGADWRIGRRCDYVIRWPDDYPGLAFDWQLRKLNPPTEPESITRREECVA